MKTTLETGLRCIIVTEATNKLFFDDEGERLKQLHKGFVGFHKRQERKARDKKNICGLDFNLKSMNYDVYKVVRLGNECDQEIPRGLDSRSFG